MRIVRNLTAAAGVLALAGILSACTAPLAPLSHDAPEPVRYLCPRDRTFPHGSCWLGPDVAPAPESMHVAPGTPSAICDVRGKLFECPAGYVG